MSQNLKKETCTGECPQCNIYNIAQRRVGSQNITDTNTINEIAKDIQEERCPDGKLIRIDLLKPANIKQKKRIISIW